MEEVLENKKANITIIGNVYETYNYDMFKTLEGNRETNKVHIGKLINSMEEIYLVSPIIVNSRMEIIDGQHRYEAAKAIDLPIRYIIDQNAGLRAVQLLNSRSKDWGFDDYLNSYVKLGYNEYIIYKEFKDKHNLSHSICRALLHAKDGGSVGGEQYNKGQMFKDGRLEIRRLEFAEKIAAFIIECSEFYKLSTGYSFAAAIMTLSENKDFDFDIFKSKLKTQQGKMYPCNNIKQTIELIESIYNYRNRNKVNLRF